MLPRTINSSNDWIEILFTYNNVEAEIVKDLLEAENIQVVVKSLKISPYPVNIGKLGEIRVFVKSEDREKAEGVLNAMKQSPGTEKDD